MPTKQSPSTTIILTPEERELILTLRADHAAEVVTVPASYLELLTAAQHRMAEAQHSLAFANNLLVYLNSQSVAAE